MRRTPRPHSRQQEALTELDELQARSEGRPAGVFAREYGPFGGREFFVEGFEEFATAFIAAVSRPQRASGDPPHVYEVLVGRKPCWLFFDLECFREHNPHFVDAAVAPALRAALVRFAPWVSGACFFVLDSSSPRKFSQHIIVRGGSAGAFLGAPAAGRFVQAFLGSCDVGGPLGCFAAGGSRSWVVDTSVYTMNRNFRTAWSSKFGRPERLVPRWDLCHGLEPLPPREALLFSLASFVPFGPGSAGGEARKQGQAPPRARPGARARSRSARPVAPPPDPATRNLDVERYCCGLWDLLLARCVHGEDPAALLRDCLDEARNRGFGPPVATVRFGRAFSDGYNFTLGANRFCLSARRAHRRCRVLLRVRFDTHVVTQTCLDLDCRHFESAPIPLPH